MTTKTQTATDSPAYEHPTYQVRDWDTHFEGAKSRTYKNKTSVQMPTKHGLGYRGMVNQKDGAALFGAWCSMCQILSSHPPPREGYCTHDGTSHGRPLKPSDLELLTDIPAKHFANMFTAASLQDVDWVRVTSPRIPQAIDLVPKGTILPLHSDSDLDSDSDSCASKSPKPKKPMTDTQKAERIYEEYPKKVGKGKAIASIVTALKNGADPNIVINAVIAYGRATNSWPAEDRQYIPNPATWFNQERWTDDQSEWTKGTKQAANGSDYVVQTTQEDG